MPVLKNTRHEQFVQLVAAGVTPTKAYVAAGFSEGGAAQGAYRLFKNEQIQARVNELRNPIVNAAIQRAAVDRAWVLTGLKKNYERAMQEEAVLDREGNETGEYTYEGSVANRALELIGKELGMFVEQRRELPKIEDVPDELLREWAATKTEVVQ